MINSDNCCLFFYFYQKNKKGNEENVPIDSSLLTITDQFTAYPCMGILCCLDKIQPIADTSNNSATLTEIIDFMFDSMPYRVLATFCSKQSDDCYKVNLHVETKDTDSGHSQFTSLADLLVEKAYAMRSLDEGKRIFKSEPKLVRVKRELLTNREADYGNAKAFYDELVLDSNQRSSYFTVTHIETIAEFYIRQETSRETDQLRPLMEKMQYFYEKKVNLAQPKLEVNTPCVYFDDEKKAWHRALVTLTVDANHCVVRLVDIGKSKYVNRVALRAIYGPFMELPCQVAKASLSDLSSEQQEDEIDEVLNNKFKAIALGRNFLGKVCSVSKSQSGMNKYSVNLFDETGESVFMLLVQDHVPMPSSKLEESVQSVYDTTQVFNNTTILNGSSFSVPAEVTPRPPADLLVSNSVAVSVGELNGYTPVAPSFGARTKRAFLQDINQDPTSPFPVHAEETEQEKVGELKLSKRISF